MKKNQNNQIIEFKKKIKFLNKELEKHKERITELKLEKANTEQELKEAKREIKILKENAGEHKEEVEMLYGVINELTEKYEFTEKDQMS